MEPLVSVIVPVYNAEKTIGRCAQSILNQTFRDLELLLIDDGSKDSSGAICDKLAAEDSRVRVFHQKNAGVSAARNLALDSARGKYLQFSDSDDWVTPDATKALVDAAEGYGCDLVVADFYRVIGERLSRKGDIEDNKLLSREEYAGYMMENPADFYYGVLWNKLYRRDIVETHQLRMSSALNWCEDTLFNLEYLHYVKTVFPLQVPIYYYVKTKNSLANQAFSIPKTVRMKVMLFEYYNQFFKSVLDEEAYEKSRLKVYRFLVDAAGDGSLPLLTGGKKLGEERISVSPNTLTGESLFHDAFRQRKLLERFLETVALKYDVTMAEAKLLLCLARIQQPATKREMADFANLSRSGLTLLLQKLAAKGILKTEDEKGEKEKTFTVVFSEEAKPLLADLENALQDSRDAAFFGLSPEELSAYQIIYEKIQANIREIL